MEGHIEAWGKSACHKGNRVVLVWWGLCFGCGGWLVIFFLVLGGCV